MATCCLRGFKWEGQPTGRIGKLGNNPAYIAGSNPDAAVLFVHDLLGWTFPNARLLADHFAEEAGVTVYLPDFFDGWVVDFDLVVTEQFHKIDLAGWQKANGREVREPEIFACARELREKHKTVGAIGFCYGGWAVYRLGAREHQPPLVDFISAGHPSHLTKQDIDEVAVPVQMLSTEIDQMYTPEMKTYTFETLTKLQIPFDFQHFPKAVHGCLSRGDEKVPGERDTMVRGKNAAVSWFKQWLPLAK